MKLGQKLWTRDELILAINLYCKIPFGKIHNRNPEVMHLANLLGRTPSSVSYKLVNFASLDPSIRESGRTGAVNTSKLDKKIWNEFYNNLDTLAFESEKLLAKFSNTTVEQLNNLEEFDLTREGKTRNQLIKARVNQNFFRRMVLSSYDFKCCITGITQPELLVAGHIIPWSVDVKNRLNPQNGLAFNTLHDRAFELGFFTITPDYKIKVSSILKKQHENKSVRENFIRLENTEIILPSRFLPSSEFLAYHNRQRFKK